jgi:hypothetical protein
MPSSRSEARIALALVAAALANPAGAGDKLAGDVSPYGKLSASVANAQVEAGADLVWNNAPRKIPPPAGASKDWREWQLRLFGRVPTTGGGDSTRTQLDRETQTWRLGARVAHGTSTIRPPSEGGGGSTWAASLQAEYGYARFEYFPSGVETDRQHKSGQSVAFEAQWMQFHPLPRSGRQVAPQLRVRYARDWRAADEVGVVVPGAAGAPATVQDLVIAPPDVKPELSGRIAVPFTFGGEFGYAPAVMYTASGSSGDWGPGSKIGRVRGEAFVYWFPATVTGGGRVGLGAYVDRRVRGTDTRDETEYGALLDVRLGANLLEY